MNYKSNIDTIIKRLEQGDKALERNLQLGMIQGMREFEGRMIEQQLSGRKGSKYLYRRTGNAANSWILHERGNGKNFVVSLGSRAKYLVTHQKGLTIYPKSKKYLKFKTSSGFVSTKSVKMPKRLFITEMFTKQGRTIIKKRMVSNLKKQGFWR